MMIMLVLSFFSWWYGRGWQHVAASFGRRLRAVANTFSVGQLLRTLFAPWKRIITYPGASLAERFRAWGDNLFSRTIGFVVRLLVLLAALLVSITVGLLTTLELIIWPLLPLAIVVCIIKGII